MALPWLRSGLGEWSEIKQETEITLVPLFRNKTFTLSCSFWDSAVIRETESSLQSQRKQKIHEYLICLVITLYNTPLLNTWGTKMVGW